MAWEPGGRRGLCRFALLNGLGAGRSAVVRELDSRGLFAPLNSLEAGRLAVVRELDSRGLFAPLNGLEAGLLVGTLPFRAAEWSGSRAAGGDFAASRC